MEEINATSANTIVVLRHFKAVFKKGLYIAIKKRLIGLSSSRLIFPRINQSIRTGTTVTDKNAAAAIA